LQLYRWFKIVLFMCAICCTAVAGNLLSTLMSSYDDDISDDGASDEQRVTEPSTVELD